MCGEGGLYILRRSQIRTTSQYDKRLNNLKMVKNWRFQRGNCFKYYEEKKLFEATYLPGLIGEWQSWAHRSYKLSERSKAMSDL
jgi:hypothetical protein